jgi:hypothetical protein
MLTANSEQREETIVRNSSNEPATDPSYRAMSASSVTTGNVLTMLPAAPTRQIPLPSGPTRKGCQRRRTVTAFFRRLEDAGCLVPNTSLGRIVAPPNQEFRCSCAKI